MDEGLALRKARPQELTYGELSEHYPGPAGAFPPGPGRDDLGIRELWRSLQRRRFAILAIVLIITTIATLLMLRAKSTYLASTVIEIGKDQNPILKPGDHVQESELDLSTAIKTSMVLLKSHELLEDVVVGLQLDKNPKFYEEPGRWSLKRLFQSKATNLGNLDNSDLLGKSGKESTRPPSERLRLDPYVQFVEENLEVEQIKGSRALKIDFIHTDPTIAAAVADGVARGFIQRNFQNKTERFSNVVDWLDQSTKDLKGRVEKAEQALANYTRENNIFAMEGKSTLTTDKLAKLHDQMTRAESDRILKETLYDEVKRGRVDQVPEVFAEMTSKSTPRIVELNKQLNDLTASEAQMAVHYGPSNPQIQELREQIVAIKGQIEGSRKALNDKLQTEYDHALRDEASLKTALLKAKAEAVNENQAAIHFDILKQEVDTAKQLYTEFLQKSNQSKMEVAEQYSNIHILDHAKVPNESYGPRRGLNILLWFIVSLVAGVGVGFLLEFFDNTIKSGNDVSQFLQLSTLAAIPYSKSMSSWESARLYAQPESVDGKKLLPSASETGSDIISAQNIADSNGKGSQILPRTVENYHGLRTSVLLSTSDGPPKTILVTSSEPCDGKTTTAVNLALSLCELDARVLLIDADMRRPTAHKMFSLDPSLGLSTYLSRDVSINKLIHRLSKNNLSVLASGPVPPNPATLISSSKMKLLMDVLENQFDHIVIDSPPVVGLTDAAILSTYVNGVVLVVYAGQSKRDIVRRAKYNLQSVGAKILGVVLNKVDPKADEVNDAASRRYYQSASSQ
jgi:polysaccharide biosynthesis transport protein